jgi:tetratricopeptide (TPR) repeat protein
MLGLLRAAYHRLAEESFRRVVLASSTKSSLFQRVVVGFSPGLAVRGIVELVAEGRREEARVYAERAIRATGQRADLHMRWVRQLRYLKEFDIATALCNASFVSNGDQPLLRLNRGYLLYEAGDYQQAAEDLEIAAASRPHSIEESLVAASARMRVNQVPKAKQEDLIGGFFRPADATFQADHYDPDAVKRSLARYGCAWIRGLFDVDELTRFDRIIEENRQGMLDVYRELDVPETFMFVGLPLYFASEPNRTKIQACFKNSYPALFDPTRMPGVDNRPLPRAVFDTLRKSGLDKVIREYLRMDRLYTSAAACHIRHMIPQGTRSYGEFHQDNRLYNSDAEILTLWFPFRYEHGPMPSLEFLPIRSDSHLPCVSVCGIDNDMFEPGAFWRPAYELGDAVLLSGFSPHRTYFEADMTVERTSIDFRFFASKLPEPIYEDAPA